MVGFWRVGGFFRKVSFTKMETLVRKLVWGLIRAIIFPAPLEALKK